MGYEVEIKFRVADHAHLERLLRAIGADSGGEVEQEDLYFAHPTRDFAVTDEAFRVRRDGSTNCVTYKGPKQSGPTKTRREIEVPFADGRHSGDQLRELFEALGFRTVATVRKARRVFRVEHEGRSMSVALDRAEGLGLFAEVEALVEGPDDLAEAQAHVLGLAKDLGLDTVESRSYLRMLLDGGGAIRLNPAGQT